MEWPDAENERGERVSIVLFGSDALRFAMQRTQKVSRGFFGLRTNTTTQASEPFLRRIEK
jgi:hypothetical protein